MILDPVKLGSNVNPHPYTMLILTLTNDVMYVKLDEEATFISLLQSQNINTYSLRMEYLTIFCVTFLFGTDEFYY